MNKAMIELPNGCWCSPLTVNPKNWKGKNLSAREKKQLVEKDWYISYRFYDPTRLDKDGNIIPKQRHIKGMNDEKTFDDRRDATQVVLDDEIELLKIQGYNPWTNKCYKPVQTEIDPDTPFLEALYFAKSKLKKGDSVKNDIKSILGYVDTAARQLNLHRMAIGEVRRKHLKLLLEQLGKIKEKWSANTFNQYRSHLSMLFNELLEYDAVEGNPLRDIKKQKHAKRIREVLTDREREQVFEHLSKVYPAFCRAMEIFFHSGFRETEMLRLKTEDVDLKKERFKVTVLKASQPVEEWREIKAIALPLWQEHLQLAQPGQQLFSYNFLPGPQKPRDEYITKNWERWVKNKTKKGIGITKDFYGLKHLHTTEVIDLLENNVSNAIEEAAKHNGHKSTQMVEKHYDVKASGRKGKLVKMLPNAFVRKDGSAD